MKTLDIVIVNWNSKDLLYECLCSLQAADKNSFILNKVIVVDNNSTDHSLAKLASLNLPIHIIHNSINKGFACACNQGGFISDADYLLFLNPDTRLYKDSLDKPIEFMDMQKNKDVGIVGIQLLNQNGLIQPTCSRFPNVKNLFYMALGLNKIFPKLFKAQIMREWSHDTIQQVDQVMGAFFLVRNSLYKTIGGFDERYFVYFEEVDFSLRTKELNYKTIYLPYVQAYHKGGGVSEQIKAGRLFYSLRSRILYAFKNFNIIEAVFLLFITSILEPITRIIFSLLKLSIKQCIETIKAYGMFYKALPSILFSKKTRIPT